jgi:hypothetical protein
MELKAGGCRSPLFFFLSRALKIVVFYHREWQHSGQELDACQELLVVDPHRHKFIS